jgi:hypothetical protein
LLRINYYAPRAFEGIFVVFQKPEIQSLFLEKVIQIESGLDVNFTGVLN